MRSGLEEDPGRDDGRVVPICMRIVNHSGDTPRRIGTESVFRPPHVESTGIQLIHWRMCKEQQMGWSRAEAQQLPRVKTARDRRRRQESSCGGENGDQQDRRNKKPWQTGDKNVVTAVGHRYKDVATASTWSKKAPSGAPLL
jgi:hypothetical protein